MKKITGFLITLMMLVSFFSFTGYKEVKADGDNYIYISADGNDETGDGSESNPYLTFDKALENYSSDKTIYSTKGPVNTKQTNYRWNQTVSVAGDFSFDSEVRIDTSAKSFFPFKVNTNDELRISGNFWLNANHSSGFFDVYGKLIMNGTKLSCARGAGIRVWRSGQFIMNDGNIIASSATNSVNGAIFNYGYVEINGGNISDISGLVINNLAYGNLVINDGIIEDCTNSKIDSSSNSLISGKNVVVNGGTIKNNKVYSILNIWPNDANELNLIVNGGEITNNITNRGAIFLDTDWYSTYSGPSTGTGNFVTAEINSGSINNNTCIDGGCAITLKPSFSEDLTPSKLIINGGEIKNNITNTGISGGIYNGTYSITEINKCNISNNTYQGTYGAYRGGGIYNDGILKLKNVAIVNNHSTVDEKAKQRGAGIGTCPTSNNYLYFNDGLFLYNNTSTKGKSDISIHATGVGSEDATGLEQFYIPSHTSDAKSLNLKERLSDGSIAEFHDYGTINPIRDITLYSDVEYTQDELDSILQNYDVIISNNTSAGAGGGIGSNGTIIIGEKDEVVSQVNISASCDECIVEQPEKIEVTLYDKNNDKIRDVELLKSENYTASIYGLADIPSYRVEQVSLGHDYATISNVQIDEPVDNGDGVMVRNINFELNNECVDAQGTTAKLKKYMVVDKNAEIPSSRFEFSIAAGQGNDPDINSAVVYPGVEPENVMINGVSQTGHVNFNAGENTVAGPLTGVATDNQKYAVKDITLDFRNVTFTEPGVYRYVLTENSNSNSAINNDAQPVRVIDVHIIWNDDASKLIVGGYVGYLGNVTASPKLLPDFSYDYEDTDEDGTISQEEKDAQAEAYQEAYDAFIASIQDGSGKDSGSYVNAGEPIGVEAGEKSDKYVNNFETYSLTLGKKVAGVQASRDEYFKFNVTIENAGSKTLMLLDMSNAEQSTHANNSTSYSVSEMNLENNRDDNENMTGNQIQANDLGTASFTVYLHHGQSIKLDGIPKNATYTITEVESPGYTTKSTNASGTIESDIEALFVNERGGIVPTGLIVKNIPIILVASVGIFLFVLAGKNRNKEDH